MDAIDQIKIAHSAQKKAACQIECPICHNRDWWKMALSSEGQYCCMCCGEKFD